MPHVILHFFATFFFGRFANFGDLDIELTVNGVVKQKSNTGKMIFGISDIIRHLAGMMTLEPGDIIATGTPAGVGQVKAGDTMEIWCEGIGSASVPVMSAATR